MQPNYENTRQMMVRFTLNATERHHPEVSRETLEPLIKEYVAENYTDEVLAHQFREQAAQERAKDAEVTTQWLAERDAKVAAQKVTATHNAKLADANKVAMTYQERAETAEKRATSLENQIEGLMKGKPPARAAWTGGFGER
jgi:hypothetical protein